MSLADPVKERPKRLADWLLAPLKANRAEYVKIAIAAVIINLFTLASSLFSMVVYNRVLPNNATSSLIALSIGLGILLIFDFALKLLRGYFIDVAGADVDRVAGESVFNRLLAIRLDHKQGSTGGLASIMRELETLRDFFTSATLTAMVDVPFILVTLGVIALIGGKLVLVPLIMIPIVLLVGWLTQPAMDRLSTRLLGQAMLKQSVLIETIGALEMVKTVSAGGMLKQRWAAAVDHQARTSMLQRLVASIGITVAGTAQQIAYAGIVVAGVGMIAAGDLTMGALIACSILGGRAVAPLTQIANLLSRLNSTRAAYRQLNRLMETPIEGNPDSAIKLDQVKGHIEFKSVIFSYPGSIEKALDTVSFTIKAGEKVALLGRIGSGKSTVARLIAGLYPPTDGLVMIDGTEIRQLDPEKLRGHIGAVLQDTVLLSGTVRDNIQLDRPEVDDTELLRAASLSGTHDFMGRLANGYDLILADRGESLSGGQRQSIAIARALAGAPSVLLLDEPSSAMDNQTEQALIQRLSAEFKDRTVVIVTHRVPLLKLVDRIIMLDAGKIAMDGPRDAVLQKLTRPAGEGGN